MVRAVALAVAIAVLSIAILVPPAQAYTYVCMGQPQTVCDLAPPTAFVAQTMPDGIHLSWQAPPVDGAIERYVVHRSHIESGGQEDFDAGLGLSYVDVPEDPGAYVYHVTAEYGSRGSIPSNPFLAKWPHCTPVGVLVEEEPFVFYSKCLEPLPF